MMFTACLPWHSQNPTRTNRSSGLVRNSYLLNKQMIIDNSCLGLANTQDERFTPFLVIKIIDNSCLGLANTQDERFTPFLVIKIKGNDC
jgi:hypothetical protein